MAQLVHCGSTRTSTVGHIGWLTHSRAFILAASLLHDSACLLRPGEFQPIIIVPLRSFATAPKPSHVFAGQIINIEMQLTTARHQDVYQLGDRASPHICLLFYLPLLLFRFPYSSTYSSTFVQLASHYWSQYIMSIRHCWTCFLHFIHITVVDTLALFRICSINTSPTWKLFW